MTGYGAGAPKAGAPKAGAPPGELLYGAHPASLHFLNPNPRGRVGAGFFFASQDPRGRVLLRSKIKRIHPKKGLISG